METQIKKAATSTTRRSKPASQATPQSAIGGEVASVERHRAMITEAAYFCAARRGFAPGHELEDWLTAEAEIGTRRLARVESRGT